MAGETPEGGAQAPEQGVEPSPIEALAQKLGWKADFSGEGAVDAETFIMRGRTINDRLNKTVSNLRREMDALKEGIEVVKFSTEQSSKREIAKLKSEISDLKAQRRQAIEAGNADTVDQLDGRIGELETTVKESQAAPAKTTPPGMHPDFEPWLEKNTWYRDDREMNIYANSLQEHPEVKAAFAVSYTRGLNKVKALVKAEFPERFEKKKEDPPPEEPGKEKSSAAGTRPAAAVTPSHQRAGGKIRKATAADLSYEQRRVGSDFVSQGLYKSLDEYAQSLSDFVEGGKK